MSGLEMIGGALIGAAAILVTTVKSWRSKRGEGDRSIDYEHVPNDDDKNDHIDDDENN